MLTFQKKGCLSLPSDWSNTLVNLASPWIGSHCSDWISLVKLGEWLQACANCHVPFPQSVAPLPSSGIVNDHLINPHHLGWIAPCPILCKPLNETRTFLLPVVCLEARPICFRLRTRWWITMLVGNLWLSLLANRFAKSSLLYCCLAGRESWNSIFKNIFLLSCSLKFLSLFVCV